MTSEHSRTPYDDIADAVNFAYGVQREVLLDIAQGIDERLRDEFTRMIDEEGWTCEELRALLEQAEPGSAATMSEQMRQKLDEYWYSPEQKKSRHRDNWQAFVRGLGGVGAGFYAIAEGMSNIGFAPRRRK